MNDLQNTSNFIEKTDEYLADACIAESKKDYSEAERLFGLALFCDVKARADIKDAQAYVIEAGPVYYTRQNTDSTTA